MADLKLKFTLPDAESFKTLRDSADWGTVSLETAAKAIGASLYGVCAYKDDRLVGMARIVGDGIMNIYIQDVIVDEAHRGQGVGQKLISHLIKNLQDHCPSDCTVGLMAVKNQDEFYSQLGFIARPNAQLGSGMIAQLGDLS